MAEQAKLWRSGSFADEVICSAKEAFAALEQDQATVKFEAIERVITPVRSLLDTLSEELGTPIRRSWANLYFSTDGVGVAEHADGHEVMALQVSGRKKWTYWPLGAAAHVTLRPGSLLFLPRGVKHATQASGPSISLSLSFACYTLADVALGGLERRIRAAPRWNRPVTHEEDALDQEEQELDALLRSLGTDLAARGALMLVPPSKRLL